MLSSPIRSTLLVCVATLGLAGCADYYGRTGYGGLSVGYGSPYYSSYYGGPYYGGYYGSRYYSPYYGNRYLPYYGWYRGFYYPGTGYYIYDRYRRPHRWTDAHRRFWESRRIYWQNVQRAHPNWSGFQKGDRDRVRVYRQPADRDGRKSGRRDRDR